MNKRIMPKAEIGGNGFHEPGEVMLGRDGTCGANEGVRHRRAGCSRDRHRSASIDILLPD